MKNKIVLLQLSLVFAAFLSAPLVRADDESDGSGQVSVDVVVDMTEAGHKIVHPTPAKPAYYLPISVGYKEFGYAREFQRPPPNSWEVEHALAKALYSQGYQLMTKEGRPSLVLVFWWGYLAPQQDDIDAHLQATAVGQMPNFGIWAGLLPTHGGGMNFRTTSDGANGASSNGQISIMGIGGFDPDTTGYTTIFTIGTATANDEQMLSLVAGNTIDDHQKFPDPRLDSVVQMSTQPRYYVMVSAFDFQSWLHHKPVLLWRAHVSTELWGHYFDQVVGTLINTAAPLFGRETKVPHFISATTLPLGHVIVGTPEVKDYPVAASAPGKQAP